MELKTANINDLEKIISFYKYAIENTPTMKDYGRWIYGLHPTDEMIEGYIKENTMYYVEDNGIITLCVGLAPYQGDDYHDINWSKDLSDDEVYTVHILCVNPDFQGKGLARNAMAYVIEKAKQEGKKAVRFDALDCNKPANTLYQSMGFTKTDCRNLYAANTGYIDFNFYEMNI
ncbi:MAG: GNAT family N-acetyltransferase [Clostridia bacterium]|nr:GNAT family N-acetyltransferase [Clostridia bacterium]